MKAGKQVGKDYLRNFENRSLKWETRLQCGADASSSSFERSSYLPHFVQFDVPHLPTYFTRTAPRPRQLRCARQVRSGVHPSLIHVVPHGAIPRKFVCFIRPIRCRERYQVIRAMLKIIMPIKRVTACATPCKISEEVNERASAVFVGGGRTDCSLDLCFLFPKLDLESVEARAFGGQKEYARDARARGEEGRPHREKEDIVRVMEEALC